MSTRSLLFLCCTLAALGTEPPVPKPPKDTAQTDPAGARETHVMVVTAAKTEQPLEEVPTAVTVRDQQALDDLAAVHPGDELAGIPGVFMRRDGAGSGALSITLRGLGGVHGNDTFLALLDGIPFLSANEEVLPAEIPIGAVSRVEVVRGPVSALYGRGGLSGAVNYITRTPRGKREVALNLRGGSFGYAKPHLSASLPVGDHQLLIDGYAEHWDGKRAHTTRDAENLLLKDVWFLSPAHQITAWFNGFHSTQEPGGQRPLDAAGKPVDTAGGRNGYIGYGDEHYRRRTFMGALRHTWLPGDRLSVTTTLHYRNGRDQNTLAFYDPYGFDPEHHTLRLNGFENDLTGSVLFFEPRITYTGSRHQLTAGINWEQADLKETDWWTGQNGLDPDTYDYYFYEINIDYRTGEVVNRHHPLWVDRQATYHGDARNRFRAVYVQDALDLSERATLTLGLRYDHFKRDAQIDSDVDFDGLIDTNPLLSDQAASVSPKLALQHHFHDAWNAYAAYGEGFHSNFGAVWQWDPGLYERGNDVKPSVVENLEFGIKGAVPGFRYSVSWFDMTQRDRLVFIPNPNGFGPPKASNADQFESRGLELEADIALGRRWNLALAYGYTDTRWASYRVGATDYTGRRPTGVPTHLGRIGLQGQLGDRLRVWADYQVFDDYFVTLDNRIAGGGYDLLDLGCSWALPALDADLQLVGKNVLNTAYDSLFGTLDPATATPGLPAHAMLNLHLRFGH